MNPQSIQELLFKMLFKILNFLKIFTFLTFITNIAEASKLIFDVSNSQITLGNENKVNDFKYLNNVPKDFINTLEKEYIIQFRKIY